MRYSKKNLADVERIDCPCGFSRRPFADNPAHDTASFHGTIFTNDKQALPHLHVPANGKSATHETYLVTDEDTREGAFIYLGKGAVRAVPGTVVYVHPGVIHGGVGDFTPLILGAPGFVEEGAVEIEDQNSIDRIIKSNTGNILEPILYSPGPANFVQLSAEQPALLFPEKLFNQRGTATLLIQTEEDCAVYAGRVQNRNLQIANRSINGPSYITVLSGEGTINVKYEDRSSVRVEVRTLDTLLIEPETEFQIEGDLATAVMIVHPKNLNEFLLMS